MLLGINSPILHLNFIIHLLLISRYFAHALLHFLCTAILVCIGHTSFLTPMTLIPLLILLPIQSLCGEHINLIMMQNSFTFPLLFQMSTLIMIFLCLLSIDLGMPRTRLISSNTFLRSHPRLPLVTFSLSTTRLSHIVVDIMSLSLHSLLFVVESFWVPGFLTLLQVFNPNVFII